MGERALVWWENPGSNESNWIRYKICDASILARSLCVGDVKNNGAIDVIAGGEHEKQIVWWENQTNPSNQAPVVEAGPDWEIPIGGTVVLDSAWFEDDSPVANHSAVIHWGDGNTETNPSISDSSGKGWIEAQHTYTNTGLYQTVLKVSDEAGATAWDVFDVTVSARTQDNDDFWLEAEDWADCFGGARVGERDDRLAWTASNSEYINLIPDDPSSSSIRPYGDIGVYSQYTFDVTVPGAYVLWARLCAETEPVSFYAAIQSPTRETIVETGRLWRANPTGIGRWAWNQLCAPGNEGTPITFSLHQIGRYTLTIIPARGLLKLDKLLLTSRLDFEPVDIGEPYPRDPSKPEITSPIENAAAVGAEYRLCSHGGLQ